MTVNQNSFIILLLDPSTLCIIILHYIFWILSLKSIFSINFDDEAFENETDLFMWNAPFLVHKFITMG